MKKILTALCSLPVILLAGTEYYQAPAKKIIECGWATRLPIARLAKDISAIEKSSPCSGMSIRLSGKDASGRVLFSSNTVSLPANSGMKRPYEFKREHFIRDIEILKNIKFKKFTDNFIVTTRRSGYADWFSDEDWKIVCGNFRLMAEIARECRLKGLILDLEWYRDVQPMFEKLPDGRNYEETSKMVRKRGQQWGKEVFGAYPDIKLLFFFLMAWKEDLSHTPECSSLLIHFINGIYDVLPPAATMIEGHEHHGYGAASDSDFARLRTDVSTVFPRMIDKKNIEKYRRQTQFSCAYFLDAYLLESERKRSFAKRLAPGVDKYGVLNYLRRNLAKGMELSDEYVWIWSEAGRWYSGRPGHPDSKMIWEKHCPGVTEAFESVLSPLGFVKRKLAGKEYVNLLKNGNFSHPFDKRGMPEAFYFWQNIKGGRCVPENDSSNAPQISGVRATFTLSQSLQVRHDQLYFVRSSIRTSGSSGKYALLCAFKDAAGRECARRTSVSCRFVPSGKNGRRIAEMAVLVPGDAVIMHIRLLGSYQGDDDVLVCDRMEAYKILE